MTATTELKGHTNRETQHKYELLNIHLFNTNVKSNFIKWSVKVNEIIGVCCAWEGLYVEILRALKMIYKAKGSDKPVEESIMGKIRFPKWIISVAKER